MHSLVIAFSYFISKLILAQIKYTELLIVLKRRSVNLSQ
jgi:hypothetical protein